MKLRPSWPGWRSACRTLVGADATTGNLALAVGLGALIAPTPVLGLHTWMALGLALLFKQNRLAAVLGSNIANPVTMLPLVWLDVRIGALVLGRDAPSWPGRDFVWQRLGNLYLEAWLGSAIIGPVLMVLSYGLAALLLGRARRLR